MISEWFSVLQGNQLKVSYSGTRNRPLETFEKNYWIMVNYWLIVNYGIIVLNRKNGHQSYLRTHRDQRPTAAALLAPSYRCIQKNSSMRLSTETWLWLQHQTHWCSHTATATKFHVTLNELFLQYYVQLALIYIQHYIIINNFQPYIMFTYT
jgi:hypothetical protein